MSPPKLPWRLIREQKRTLAETHARALVRVRQRIGLIHQYYAGADGLIDYAALSNSPRGRRLVAELLEWTADLFRRSSDLTRAGLTSAYLESAEITAEQFRRFGVDLAQGIENARARAAAAIEFPTKAPQLGTTLARNAALSRQRFNAAVNVLLISGDQDAAIAAFRDAIGNQLSRAVRVLETEGTRAINGARATVFDYAVDVEAGEGFEKYWITTMDGNERDTHAALNDQAADADGLFHSGGLSASMPGGWGDPAEDCNCRCEIGIRRRTA